ncbi:MAG: fatty acid desaturase [Calditrichales bacterium]|nr:MAG: fatty acid desaturase [Calditrichales bacterium]
MQPDLGKSLWQVANSFIPYTLLLAAMYFSLGISYWLTLGLAVPAGGFMVRIFIIFHDCGHGSFFKSRRANTILGFIAGVITFTPYHHWTHKHAIHHATSGDLDRRGMGDIWTLTVKEYLGLSKRERFTYHLFRNPFVMLLIGPVYMFLFYNRFVTGKASAQERHYVYATNLGILALATAVSALIGIEAYLLIQLPVITLGGIAGVWLFYVQHQFDGVYWERNAEWDYQQAAIHGSSFYKLPKVLQWFSGNIGFHHVHHLSSRIPNYHLESCHKEVPVFKNIKPLSMADSLKCIKHRLWDEENNRLVGYDNVNV